MLFIAYYLARRIHKILGEVVLFLFSICTDGQVLLKFDFYCCMFWAYIYLGESHFFAGDMKNRIQKSTHINDKSLVLR